MPRPNVITKVCDETVYVRTDDGRNLGYRCWELSDDGIRATTRPWNSGSSRRTSGAFAQVRFSKLQTVVSESYGMHRLIINNRD
eukprot:SAG22_NODE_7802_length_707_cov_1.302632_2_plen_84_part_00